MKTIAALINFCLVAMCVACFISCKHSSANTKKDAHEGQMFVQTKAFQASTGWGYCIYVNDSVYIKQSFIPGINGRHSFANSSDALKTGELAIKKMETTHKMPFISQSDLQQLHIQLPN